MAADVDTVVVGGGIVGLAVAWALTEDGRSVTVLEKELVVGGHQTGHNSGVVHAGVYYAPGSLKARLCRAGRQLLRSFCAEHDVVYDECGKVVVATEAGELDALGAIEARATANGVPGIRRLSTAELGEIEPHVSARAALWSPATAITDFPAVCHTLARLVTAGGGQVVRGAAVTAIDRDGPSVGLTVDRPGQGSRRLTARRVVLCGGLQSDRLARLAGGARGPRIVPFRGEYHALRADRRHLVRGLVYPVPDPRYPFLGIHLTRRVDGGVLVGPNAVVALAREGYRWRDVRPADIGETLTDPGFLRLARRHWRTGLAEVHRSLSRHAFVAEARRYLPELDAADLVSAPAGVRAQALTSDGRLEDDFVLEPLGPVLAVRNAPSPAATSSLAIGRHVAEALGRD